jgi:hypothetical protein
MKIKQEYIILAGIILTGILFRLFFALGSTSFDNDQAHYTIRQVENIQNSGLPLFKDQLSYSGREGFSTVGFFYILYILGLFIPSALALKIIPNIIACLASVVIYLIILKMTKNRVVSLFSASVSLFIPIYLIATTNTLSATSTIIPLILVCLYFFINIEPKKNRYLIFYIGSLWLLTLVSSASFVLILCLLIYVLICNTEDIKLSKAKKEVIIFSLFSVLWLQFLIYKKAILEHGPYVIWQNIPSELIVNYFADFNIFSTIYFIGIIPFFFGLYIIYKYSFKIKNEIASLFISLTIVNAFLLIFRLIPLYLGMSLFGFCFVIFFGMFYKQLLIYIGKTKFKNIEFYLIISLIFIFFLTSIMPSFALLYSRDIIKEDTMAALKWVKDNTAQDAVILGTVNEGHLIASIAKRKNIIDTNFLLIHDINQRMKDIKTIYTSPLVIRAIELLSHYNVDYVLIDDAKETYDIDDLRYMGDECLDLVYDEKIKIYKVTCRIEKIEQS